MVTQYLEPLTTVAVLTIKKVVFIVMQIRWRDSILLNQVFAFIICFKKNFKIVQNMKKSTQKEGPNQLEALGIDHHLLYGIIMNKLDLESIRKL